MSAVDNLLNILDLEQLEQNLFRGRSPQNGWQRVYGGQVVGQALVAANRTVEAKDRLTHSLHAYFLLPGDPKVPIVYEVDRIRDGGSFTTRRVIAIQHGQPIFTMGVSFHKAEPGFDHQIAMPDVPPPEELATEEELKARLLPNLPEPMRRYWEYERPIELRPTDLSRFLSSEKGEPKQYIWIKASGPLPEDFRLHQCVLAYASGLLALGYGAGRAWPPDVRPAHHDGEPRPRSVVPPAVPRRRVAALRAGQPEQPGRARLLPGQHLLSRWPACGVGGTGGADPRAHATMTGFIDPTKETFADSRLIRLAPLSPGKGSGEVLE